MTQERQGGFSLIELLVAMTITLIVSGAIYGLLAGGQNAFRREPELTERQQNIRLAMDMIMRDTANAGVGLPPFAQLFTPGLESDPASPAGPSGLQSDQFELLTGGGQESENACASTSNSAGVDLFLTRSEVPPVDPDGPNPVPRMVFLVFSERRDTSSEDRWTTRRVTAQDVDDYPGGSGPAPPDCDPATPHAFLTFAQGTPGNAATLCAPSPLEPAGNIVAGSCAGVQAITRVVFASQVRYRIRTETDGVPVLQRSSTDDPTGGFQTLARGIEELQVQYTQVNDPDVWLDGAPVVADPALPPADAPNFGTLVNQVRVTLTSRSEAQNIQGVSAGASGPARLRGSLTSTSAPRATLMHLARGRPSPMPSPGTWYWE